jgi:hypothetical protein
MIIMVLKEWLLSESFSVKPMYCYQELVSNGWNHTPKTSLKLIVV